MCSLKARKGDLEVTSLPAFWDPLWLSLQVALLAVAMIFGPAVALALLLSRRQFFGKSLVETLVELPLVLPPTAVGFGLLIVLGRRGVQGLAPHTALAEILFTWKAAVIAAAVMAFPLVVRSARIAFEQIDPRLEKMAASLGMGRRQVLTRITLPLARRGLLAAALLGFTRALGEFGATILVAGSIPGRTQTLALAMFDDIQNGREKEAAMLLMVAVTVAFVAIFVVSRLQAQGLRREL